MFLLNNTVSALVLRIRLMRVYLSAIFGHTQKNLPAIYRCGFIDYHSLLSFILFVFICFFHVFIIKTQIIVYMV